MSLRGESQTIGREEANLGRTLYSQQKYSEAEGPLRQAANGQEKTLGRDHENTLDTKHYLGATLYRQQKYSEADGPLRQAADGRERTLGRDHEHTLATARLLQGLRLEISRILPVNVTTRYDLDGRLTAFFSGRQDDRELYNDADISQISALLKHLCPQWSKVPRTYIVLRTIGHLKFLDDLIDVGFSDYWFPVTVQSLPACLQPGVRAAFAIAQSLVLTNSIDLERGEHGQHCYFKQGEFPPLESKGILGNGGFGQVDKVLSQVSYKEYARKRVLRSSMFRGRPKEITNQFIAEIKILKRLKHHHIVEFVGSYTDSKYVGLIMSPVAEMDLAAYLRRSTAAHHNELRTFFGCLATALEFLHKHNVRHKDIKPGNILVHAGTVLLTDFGLSLDFEDASRSTTIGMVNGMTRRYCAPEVAIQGSRNTKSDIWSLGVVFMEMLVVLKDKTINDMEEFLSRHGCQQPFLQANPTTLPEFVAELERTGALSDNRALSWTQHMLSVEPQLRPTASDCVRPGCINHNFQ